MSFSRAFKYPFHNSAKVITIVLVMTIAFVICVAMLANSGFLSVYLEAADYGPDVEFEDMDGSPMTALAGIIGLLAVVAIGGFWMNGYSVSAIREVINGVDTLPDIEFRNNVGQGFWIFLSAVVYVIANVGVWLGIFFVLNFLAMLGSFISLIATIASVIAAVAFAALSGWAYFIGMGRCAVEQDRAPLFEIGRNIGVARENVGAGVRLALCIAALSIIYGIVRSIADLALGGFAGADIVVATAISVSVYYFFNLFQHFSTQHFIAQFAMETGVGDDLEYEKVKSAYD